MWLFLIQLGFVGFVVSLFSVIWRGINPNGSANRRLFLWIGAALFFFALWLYALPRFPAPFPR